MKSSGPIKQNIAGLRQRQRSDGSWRVWWEPSTSARRLGFAAVTLDADRLTWSVRTAKQINRKLKNAQALSRGDSPTGLRTVSALAQLYLMHSWYSKLSPATQLDYRNGLDRIRDRWGDEDVSRLTKPMMAMWYEQLLNDAGIHQATRMLRIMSRLMSFAEIVGWRGENRNPCLRLGLSVPPGRTRTASWDEYEALMAAGQTLGLASVSTAVALSMLNGMRLTDVLRARIDGFRDHPDYDLVWTFIRSKRKNLGAAPVHPETIPRVRLFLAQATEGQEYLLIDERTGKPYTMDRFNERWREVRELASESAPSVGDLQFRDLRRTFGRLARAGGAARSDIADMLGNSAAVNPQLGEVYMAPQLDSVARAVNSIRRSVG